MFRVLGFFANDSDADAWTRNVASRHVDDMDISLVQSLEWIYPNQPSNAARSVYRNKELDKIMKSADQNTKNIQEYKEWEKERAEA